MRQGQETKIEYYETFNYFCYVFVLWNYSGICLYGNRVEG